MMFANEALIHFFIGVGINLFIVLLFFYYGKRRPIFRFGGDSPLSLGTKKRWVAWYLFMAIFEFASSFHWGVGPRMYVELAFSVYQAVFATLGLFLIDRLAMLIIEPEEHWLPKTKDDKKQALPVIVEQLVQPSEMMAPMLTVTNVRPKSQSWLRNKLTGLKKTTTKGVEKTATTLRNLPDTVTSTIAEKRNEADERKRKEREKKEAEKKERLNKLNDSLKGY